MDEGWALTWSRRWHIIDPNRPPSRGGDPKSLCGVYLYRQSDIRKKDRLRHLLKILDGSSKAAGVCKHCNRAAREAGSPPETPSTSP